MLRPARGLSPEELDAIAGLEGRVVARDGGRLKLEWGRLRQRDGARVEDVLAWDGELLVGFVGLYGFSGASIELAGMVDPDHRGRGIGGALLDAALELCGEPDARRPLLIVPRSSAGGRALAGRHGGTLDHSEHALALHDEPVDGPGDPAIALRTARPDDAVAILRLMTDAFGFAPTDLAERLVEPGVRSLVIERAGTVVGAMRVSLHDGVGGVFGFAVDAALRGQGIGRDALRRACHELRAQGATRVALEVEVDNDRALGLYTSLGFTPVATEDYWRLSSGLTAS